MKASHLVLSTLALVMLALPTAAETAKAADAQGDVTFYSSVLPILQDNCQTCHRPNGANLGGMVAPMAFTSYQETRPWAKSIAKQVEAKLMPPWHASQNQHGVFENERTLTDAEIDTIVRWAKSGAPAGDPTTAPEPRVWDSSDGWLIGEPDLIVQMPEAYFVDDDVEDHYITFRTKITEEMLPEPRWVRAVEFRPGSSVVHHIIAPPLGGIAPGNDPRIYREGYGTLLEPGATVQWQMHYHKEPGAGTGVYDQSQAAIRFYPEGYEPKHVIQSAPMGNLWFQIPPGADNYTNTLSYTFERDSKIISFLPHAHLRGKSAVYTAFFPDGREQVLLEVPQYDFNWQTTYKFKEEVVVPAGSRIELTMAWDNSENNPYNPDPTIPVTFGEPTTDEMMFGFMAFTDLEEGYQPGATGFMADGGRQDPQAMLKKALGTDLESLSPEDRQRLMKSAMSGEIRGQVEGQGGLGGGQ